jgi:hypothetical protein
MRRSRGKRALAVLEAGLGNLRGEVMRHAQVGATD